MKKRLLIIAALFICSLIYSQNFESYEKYVYRQYTKAVAETQKRLIYINKPGALEKIGTEQIDGLKSGTLLYKVSLVVPGAKVLLDYKDYSDNEIWHLDGKIITTSNIAQSGSLSGHVDFIWNNSEENRQITGTVWYEKVKIADGVPSSGTYGISIDGGQRIELEYTEYAAALSQ